MSKAISDLLDPSKPLPFGHLFVPLVLEARTKLRQKATAAQIALLRNEAHVGWERYLLRRLSSAGAMAADCQLQAFKTVRSAFPIAKTGERRPTDRLYRQFVGVSSELRLRKLFEEFPALTEYCDVLVSNWIATVTEFLNRLEADRGLLDASLAGGRFNCPVVALQAGLSDPHHGGRCVVRLTFESGSSLIYKPRSIAPEAHFSKLLESFNTEAILHPFRTTRCWERTGYGWMENVLPHPCKTLVEVHAFYWRAGALLTLVYLARGVDMHRENLIAAGEFPVLIDLEALWHPQEHVGVADSPAANSVLRTGFLPQNNPQVGVTYGWNALASRSDSSIPALVWTSVNEDSMTRELVNRPYPDSPHLPIFADAKYFAHDFLPDILAGFRWIGRKVLDDHQGHTKFLRWIRELTQCPRRRILRSSSWYQKAVGQLTAPSFLRKNEPIAADIANLVQSKVSITETEWQALRQLEIPWLEQNSGQIDDQETLLPVRTTGELLAQESLIVDALTPVTGGDRLSPEDRQIHQGMTGVHNN